MSDLLKLWNSRAEKESAYNLYNYAGEKLKNAQIEERYYEILSGANPIDEWVNKLGVNEAMAKLIRTEILYFCRYILCGRKDRDANA